VAGTSFFAAFGSHKDGTARSWLEKGTRKRKRATRRSRVHGPHYRRTGTARANPVACCLRSSRELDGPCVGQIYLSSLYGRPFFPIMSLVRTSVPADAHEGKILLEFAAPGCMVWMASLDTDLQQCRPMPIRSFSVGLRC
jgi:hypothetical protein